SAAPPLHVCEGHDGHKDEQIVHDLGAVDRPVVACATPRDERRVQAVLASRIAKRTVRAVAGHVHAFHRRDRSSRRRWTDPARATSDTSRPDAFGRRGLADRHGRRNDLYTDVLRPRDGVIPLLAGVLCAFVAYGRWRVAPLGRRMHPTPALKGT